MATVVNLAEEVVGGVLLHAERLRGAVVAADAGALEALRWAGVLPLLLRDLRVPRVVATASIWRAVDEGEAALLALLLPPRAWQPESETQEASKDYVDHLVLVVSGFLWEYEARLQSLVALGVVRRLTVCSSLSERAHECYDFGDGAAPQKMAFDAFAASLAARNAFQPRDVVTAATKTASPRSPRSPRKQASGEVEPSDDWGWGEGDDASDGFGEEGQGSVVKSAETPTRLEADVAVVHMPLNYAPLLHAKGAVNSRDEPSLFVLSHPVCATAFPLLLTRVLRHQQRKLQFHPQSQSSGPLPAYSHVKEVMPEHIPSEFRRTLKLVAHVLGEMLVHARLDAKERIFAMGNTSLKIGHTLLRILHELQEDLTTHALQSHQAATVVLVDRTSDLVSPCSFGVSLLDRVLALLPQSSFGQPERQSSQSNRKGLHVTEIFPLHGCEPSPLSVSLPVDSSQIEHFMPSSFVGSVKWKGGASLCHPRASHDKRLQEIEKELILQRKITRSGSSKKPGEKPPSTRGRDVVLRRMSNILEAGEPTNLEHSALIELGIIVLETLERMESVQQRWDTCRERTTRHVQLRKKGAGEWIIPELADTVQRQILAAKSAGHKSEGAQSPVSFRELLSLLVHAYSLSAGSVVEDYTLQMIRKVVGESLLETARQDPKSIEMLCPDVLADLGPFLKSNGAKDGFSSSNDVDNAGEEEDWDWNEGQSPRGQKSKEEDDDDYDLLQAKAIVETHLEQLLAPLKECAQVFAKQHEHEYRSLSGEDATSLPRSLLAQVTSALTSTPAATVAELEHVVDASEQLTRAGIGLLKSGFSRFGFGGAGAGSSSGGGGGIMGESKILVIFVVGGVTFEEVQEVHTALEGNTGYQVIVGGTTITNSDILLEQLFR